VRIELFAGVEVAVGGGAGGGDHCPEGVVDVGVGDGAGFVGQEADVAVAVVGVEGGVPSVGRRVGLVLTDQVVAVGVGVVNGAVHDLFDDLGVTGGVPVVHEVARRLAVDGLRDAVAVTVVDQRDVGAGGADSLGQAVLTVVVVGAQQLLRVES